MHILIVTNFGCTRLFRNWPEILLAKGMVQRGHRVRALTYFDEKSDSLNQHHENIEGVEVERIKPMGWLTREFWSALARGPRPDVIHIHHLRNLFTFQTAYYAARENIPFVITAHGPLHDQYLSRDRDRPLDTEPMYDNLIWSRRGILNRVARDGRVKRHMENYFMHYPLAHASMIVALSNHEKELWKHIGLESEVVPNWLDMPFINQLEGEKYKEEFPHPVILFVGQFKYRKGFDVLAHAMPFVLEQIPTATFLFVGHSPIHRRELEAITRENGTSDHLAILPRVSEEDKVRLFHTADVMAMPTRYEGFGIPPLEAMAIGCPVVASDIPVVDEMVQNEYNGLLVPREDPRALADALVRVLTNNALRERLIHNGFETLKRYQEAEMLDRITQIYQRVIRAPQTVTV